MSATQGAEAIRGAHEVPMLHKLSLHNVGPAADMVLDPIAPRLNLLTGDNGLGKSFILEAAWWALTCTWGEHPAVPSAPGASIKSKLDGLTGPTSRTHTWSAAKQQWGRPGGRPPNPGLVVYARVDGSFSVWDPARNYKLYNQANGGEYEAPPAYHFSARQVMEGLTREVQRDGRPTTVTLCRGLIDEWREWQRVQDPPFELLKGLLAELGPDNMPLEPGELFRRYEDDEDLIPTIRMPYGQDVPITYAPAGVRRMCKLAYLLAWVMGAHERACAKHNLPLSRQLILLVDEPETHLHPRWQRTVVPSLLKAVDSWKATALDVQLFIATHSPLVLASVEPSFDPKLDALWKLDLTQDGADVEIERDDWHRRGDANRWLVSDVFDLKAARSKEAELAMERALALYRVETPDKAEVQEVTKLLQAALSDTDRFWMRWSAFAEEHGVRA